MEKYKNVTQKHPIITFTQNRMKNFNYLMDLILF